jgi:hypothetical protein
MKTKKILFLSFAAVAILFSSCKTDEPLSGVTLDQATLSVAVGETATLVATNQPKGAAGVVAWSTSDATIATVANGVVTGVKKGTANIVATVGTFTATCAVTVTNSTNFTASLTGTEYYPIILDGTTAKALGAKIKADFRPDEATKFLYVWDNTYTAGQSTGPNFYGEVEGWVNLAVGSVGWSGAGFFCKDGALLDKLAPLTANTDKYYLHIGVKSKDNAVHVIGMDGQSNVKFALGATAFNDNGTLIQPLGDFDRDGEWHEIEIPLSTLKTKGLLYSTGMLEKNVMFVLSGGTTGKSIELDAVFIYKKQ